MKNPRFTPFLVTWLVGLAGLCINVAQAAMTDLASAPLATSSNTAVRPNLMFILDNSGSMGWNYMPDYVNDSNACRRHFTSASKTISSMTRSGSTVTVNTTSNHRLSTGNIVRISGASPSQYNGVFQITKTSNTQFTYTISTTPTSPATVASGYSNMYVSTTTSNVCNGESTGGDPPFTSPFFNGVYYNPAVLYTPPTSPCDTSQKLPQMNATNTGNWAAVRTNGLAIDSSCNPTSGTINLVTHYPETVYCTSPGDSPTGSNCKRNGIDQITGVAGDYDYPDNGKGSGVTAATNWYDAYGVNTTSSNPLAGTYNVALTRNGGPYYYNITPIEYCSDAQLTTCSTSNTAPYTIPAYVRFCKTSQLASDPAPVSGVVNGTPKCQAKYNSSLTTTVTISSITRSGTTATVTTSTNHNLATGDTVTIAGAAQSAYNGSKTVTVTGATTFTFTVSSSTPTPATVASGFTEIYFSITNGYIYPRYGSFTRVNITPSTTTYPKSASRTDCAGSSCTYEEEMTNFANWYAYYRTRMQMMKTAAGNAFNVIDDSFRVGFVTINPGNPVSSSQYLKIDNFDPAHKESWYKKLYSQSPSGGTPLREALSRVGRHYANKIDGINTNMDDDPVQYACQQNFALLTTDGYWNGNGGVQLNGTTAIGNQDNVDSGYSRRAVGAYDGGKADAGYSNTLADVAMYYYKNDLRPDFDDEVPTTSKDNAPHQHMTTFTLGLGLDGLMTYIPDYESNSNGDFADIKAGVTRGTTRCPWEASASSVCNWPKPVADGQTALDDLWHAAVNGRGQYFSARDPNSLTTGLQGALAGITARTGAAAASATSSPNITETDNYIYSSTYRTLYWDGEIVANTIDTQSGAISTTPVWSAQALLDGKVGTSSDSRVIYKYDASSAGKVEAFTWANLDSTEQAYFQNKCASLSQCAGLTPAAQATANNGASLLSFLRGQTGNEGELVQTDKAFRNREHVLGDTVNATPAYVKAPRFHFTDNVSPDYNSFRTSNATRQGMLYIAGNDGMLHALNADTGDEVWAYIPKLVMPDLYRLADKNYAANHRFFVDGSPQIMDVFDDTAGAWKTILVGGLNGGGRGYYALDITIPDTPKALWEFCHTSTYCDRADGDLGYAYGNPVIGKLPAGNAHAGKWVVIVASGYNNVSPGTGEGYIFILDAISGALLEKVSTSTGNTTTPSGLAKISGWADNADQDATITQIYGGDLLGNLWRFDLKSNPVSVLRMASLKDNSNVAQPITTKPELGKVNGVNEPVVFVGTGRYLGVGDLADTQTQSIYAIRDIGSTHANPRAFTPRTITQTGTTASVTGGTINWSSGGWYADFPTAGERVNIDPQLVLGTLVLATNIPESSVCSVGGTSWIYQFDFSTGLAVSSTSTIPFGQKSSSGITVGIVIFRLPTGELKAVVTDAGGGKTTIGIETNPGSTQARRAGWRELVQ